MVSLVVALTKPPRERLSPSFTSIQAKAVVKGRQAPLEHAAEPGSSVHAALTLQAGRMQEYWNHAGLHQGLWKNLRKPGNVGRSYSLQRSLQKPLHDARKLKPKVERRPQDVGDSEDENCARKLQVFLWIWPRRGHGRCRQQSGRGSPDDVSARCQT